MNVDTPSFQEPNTSKQSHKIALMEQADLLTFFYAFHILQSTHSVELLYTFPRFAFTSKAACEARRSVAFFSMSSLRFRAHMQTHSAFKNYACQRCHKSFALKSYLNKHYESACFKAGLTTLFLTKETVKKDVMSARKPEQDF